MAQSSDLSPQMFRPYTIDTGTYLIAPEGLLLNELVVGVGTAQMDIQDPLEGHLAIFAQNDIVRVRSPGYLQSDPLGDSATAIAHEFWAVGALPSTVLIDVWLDVTAVNDLGTHFQYTVKRLFPTTSDQYAFMTDTLVIGYGPLDNRLVQLRATRNRTPQVDVFATGAAPWNGSETQVRLGRLDDLGAVEGEQYGLAAGANLNAEGSTHARVSEQGVHLSQLDLTLDDGSQPTVQLSSTGALKLGVNIETQNSTGLLYDPQNDTLEVRASLQAHGPIISYDGLAVNDADTTTIALAPSGGVKVGADVSDPESVDLAYDPVTRTVHIRTAQVESAQISNAQIGSAQITDAEVSGGLVSKGGVDVKNGDVTTIALAPSGKVKVGADVSDPESVDLAYDPVTRTVHIRTAQVESAQVSNAQIGSAQITDAEVSGGLVSTGDITLTDAGAPTVKLGSNGDVRIGSDIEQANGLLLDLQAGAGTLAITATTTLQGRTVFQENASFQSDVIFDGDVALQGVTTARNTIELLENGALVVGEAKSIRIDQEGITMRLEPGEHNAVKVLGIGRAAMLNAYQTRQGVQQFDMLAYYSAGVPSLNGRLMMGVASVDGGDPDLFMRMTRYFTGVRRIDIQSSLLDIQSNNIQLTGETSINGNFSFSGTASPERTFRLRNLPIRPDGLPTGAVWNNQGTLNIIQ